MRDHENESEKLAPFHQVADRLELMVQVCRVIARRVDNADISEDILEVATWIYNEVDALRLAVARLPD